MIPFAEFAPDRAAYDPAYTDVAQNVLPSVTGYRPFKSLAAFSGAVSAQVYGFAAMRQSAGNYQLFAGTETTLEKLNSSTLAWDDVSSTSYSLAAPAAWGFSQFGPYALACNIGNVTQVFNLDSDSAFSNLGGSPPQSRRLMVVGDFVVAMSTSTDARSVAWSGIRKHDFWTFGQEGSDFQSFPDGGDVMNGVGSQSGGIIFQEKVIREMYFVPNSRYTFGFRKISEGNGLVARDAIARIGGTTFYLDEDGFYMLPDGGIPTPIGNERVDNYFYSDLDTDYLQNVQATADPIRKIVFFRYVSTSNANAAQSDKMLVYNWALNKWSVVDIGLSWFAASATTGYTLDGLDAVSASVDALAFSLDSRLWKGGRPVLAGFDTSNQMGFFDGANLEGTVETASIELNPGSRSMVRGFRITTDAAGTFGRIGESETHDAATTWKTEVSPSTRTGMHKSRSSGRLNRFRARVPAGTTWEHLTGVSDIELAGAGK